MAGEGDMKNKYDFMTKMKQYDHFQQADTLEMKFGINPQHLQKGIKHYKLHKNEEIIAAKKMFEKMDV
jgi:hypothetical protein